MQKTMKDFRVYVDSLDEKDKQVMEQIDRLILEKFPSTQRSIWEGVFWGGTEQVIIGYGDYLTQRANKQQVQWFMIGVAIQKHYYSLYINAVEDKQYVAKKYKDELGKVKIGSSSVSFKKIEDLNVDTVMHIIDIAYSQWLNNE
ncbi:DUF1801 domain-containing protein [Lysinibacillus piscis]|uniref:DUF1801 domain-containing protein n=1 Tax=Lysinibacillus piscis TaxID=2518931 RepID=A0ABQ5NFR1_9BACI|nr:DUF1801 domain-containing protein [Lysinibacillus sp. KH24]GLC86902.1 hypothetical protein LYSBPC_00290 [Lysinibacillus sp. KH24]